MLDALDGFVEKGFMAGILREMSSAGSFLNPGSPVVIWRMNRLSVLTCSPGVRVQSAR